MGSFSEMDNDSVTHASSITVDDCSATHLRARFERLLEANRPALARLAACYTRTRADQEDLLQDIAIAFWRALPRFRGECSDRTFLFRIAQNRAIAHISRLRPTASTDEFVDLVDPGPDPEQKAIKQELTASLTDAVRSLPPVFREVLTLTLEGMTYSEISEILGLTETNIGVRLARGKQLLRQMLKDKTRDH